MTDLGGGVVRVEAEAGDDEGDPSRSSVGEPDGLEGHGAASATPRARRQRGGGRGQAARIGGAARAARAARYRLYQACGARARASALSTPRAGWAA